MFKGLIAMQFAVAGVALAENTADANRPMDPVLAPNPAVANPPANVNSDRDLNRDVKSDWGEKVAPAGTVRASTLIGTNVYNRQDKQLGEIKDIVLDRDGRKIGYVVLSYGGLLGMGDKLFAVPRDMIHRTGAQDRAYVELDEQTLKSAPGFDKSKWPTAANADYYRQLDDYYHRTGRSAEPAGAKINEPMKSDTTVKEKDLTVKHDSTMKSDGTMEHDVTVKTDKTEIPARPAADQMGTVDGNLQWDRRASELIGSKVENSSGANLGKINDLVLDWNKGEVRYAVLSYGGLLGMGDKLFAVPIDSFHSQGDKRELILDVPQDQLKNAPGFDQNHWPNMADPQWSKSVDEHYKTSTPAVTPKDQPKVD